MKLLIAFLKDKTREISLYAGTVGISSLPEEASSAGTV